MDAFLAAAPIRARSAQTRGLSRYAPTWMISNATRPTSIARAANSVKVNWRSGSESMAGSYYLRDGRLAFCCRGIAACCRMLRTRLFSPASWEARMRAADPINSTGA
jgi:hypothetical protein